MIDWKTLVIAIGSEWAPDGALGLEVLQLNADGSFHYEHRHQGNASVVGGEVSRSAIAALGDDLRDAGFPEIPQQDIPPGASLMEIRAGNDSGNHTVRLDYHAAARLPGYRELRVRFDHWTNALRAGDTEQLGGGLVAHSAREQ